MLDFYKVSTRSSKRGVIEVYPKFIITSSNDLMIRGGDFYATARKRVSVTFASYVNQAVNQNKLLYRDAYKITGLKGETYQKFVTQHLH